MAKKLGTLKAKRLFLGTDSGGRGTEVTSSAAELNQLGAGAVTANVTGNVTGDVKADNGIAIVASGATASASSISAGSIVATTGFTGDLTGNVTPETVTYVADGAISGAASHVLMDASAATVHLTIAAGVLTKGMTYIFECIDGTEACTITATGYTFNGDTNTIATFADTTDTIVALPLDSGRITILSNSGTVIFSN